MIQASVSSSLCTRRRPGSAAAREARKTAVISSASRSVASLSSTDLS
nr:hypothetical protein [Streptomyces sp. S501]